jgi:hypothetical protein
LGGLLRCLLGLLSGGTTCLGGPGGGASGTLCRESTGLLRCAGGGLLGGLLGRLHLLRAGPSLGLSGGGGGGGGTGGGAYRGRGGL